MCVCILLDSNHLYFQALIPLYLAVMLCAILVYYFCITCYSEVPGTTGHVTDIGETPQDGTTTQVSVVVYELYCVSLGIE